MNKKTNYFNEKEMNLLIKNYKINKNEKVFKQMKPSIDGLINGMINKEFYRNHHIKNNQDDASNECFYEILKSLERYDPDKGRLFAYMNRIVKNSLLNFYGKSRRVKDKEINYSDILVNTDNEEMDEENIFKINLDVKEDDFGDNQNIIPNRNKKLSVDETIYIVYNYLKFLKKIVESYIKNKEKFDYLINQITFDTKVKFDFSKYYKNNVFITIPKIYYMILNCIHIVLDSIIKQFEIKYKKQISMEPVSYNGSFSINTLSKIRNFVNSELKRNKLTQQFDTDELVNFMEFLIQKGHLIDG